MERNEKVELSKGMRKMRLNYDKSNIESISETFLDDIISRMSSKNVPETD